MRSPLSAYFMDVLSSVVHSIHREYTYSEAATDVAASEMHLALCMHAARQARRAKEAGSRSTPAYMMMSYRLSAARSTASSVGIFQRAASDLIECSGLLIR